MSEWTVDTLKEHLEALLADFKSHVSDTFIERDKAITEFKEQTEDKFASRNEIQTAMKDAADASEKATVRLTATFISRAEALAYVVAACAITGAVIETINFLWHK